MDTRDTFNTLSAKLGRDEKNEHTKTTQKDLLHKPDMTDTPALDALDVLSPLDMTHLTHLTHTWHIGRT